MRSCKIGRLLMMSAPLLTSATLAIPGGAAATEPTPHVTTTGVSHVLITSALLNGVIYPNGVPTSYFFQYGTTTAYGLQTPIVSVTATSLTSKVNVGQSVAGLQQGVLYHYRVVGLYGAGRTVLGGDAKFMTKQTPLVVEIAKSFQQVVGVPFILSGGLSGFASAHHAVVLQASPYPYLEAFTNIGLPGATNAAGRFAFRVANLTKSTEFRVATLDPRPVYSPITTVRAAVRVTLRVRPSGHPGLVRLYGTVTPAVSGATVDFQVQKVVRPKAGSEEGEVTRRWVSQFRTAVKKGNASFSRFSLIVIVRRGGRYRALVKLRLGGPLVSGPSGQTVVLHAAPGKTGAKG
jgi:hypothetical protein